MAWLTSLPDIYVPAFEIKVEGRRLEQNVAKTVLEVRVTDHRNPPGEFSFRLNDPRLRYINREDGLFAEGKRVEISLGYLGNLCKMIAGEISAVVVDFPGSGPATVEAEGFDLLHALTRGTVYRRYEAPDHQIVFEIAAESGMKCSADPTQGMGPRVQDHVSNLRFLEQLAEVNGCDLWLEGETLHFQKDRPSNGTVPLEWGKTLLSFSPRLSTAGQVSSIEVRGWDPVQKQTFSTRVDLPGAAAEGWSASGQKQISRGSGGKSERVFKDASVTSAQEAQALARRILSGQQQGSLTGNGTSMGNPDIRAGTILDLKGIGRFSGRYAATQATHTVGNAGYQTTFQVVRA